MRKFTKTAAFFTALLILISCSAVIADGSYKNIGVYFDSSKIRYNNDELTMENILYDDVLYVPLRAIAKVFDKEVAYDSKTKSVVILDKQLESDKSGNIGIKKITYFYDFVYLLSISLQAAGLLLLAQMVLFRNRKELARMIKSKNGKDFDAASSKRLLHDSWLSKMAFYYIAAGLLLKLSAAKPYALSMWFIFISCGIMVLLLLLLGWRKCRNEANMQF
jgi:hypothetical protein